MDKFLLLRDRTGLVQLRLPDDDVTSDRFGLASLPLESVVVVRGRVRQRPAGQENGRMATGRVEVELTEVISANPAKPNLPFQQTERIKPKVTKINNLKVFEQESWIRPFPVEIEQDKIVSFKLIFYGASGIRPDCNPLPLFSVYNTRHV